MIAGDPNVQSVELVAVVAERLGDEASQERLPELQAKLREIARVGVP